MKVSQITVSGQAISAADFNGLTALKPDLVLAFGSVDALQAAAAGLAAAFPEAHRAGCSTAGEISSQGVRDHTLVVTALQFDQVRVTQVSTVLANMEDSHSAGQRLAAGLALDGLRAVLIFGQGVQINGSAVYAGVTGVVGTRVPVTGGLAGDGGAFLQTCVLDNGGVSHNRLTCLGLYGESLKYSYGSFGGWSAFGPARKVTRCQHNVLFELDHEPALQVYKRNIGLHAKDLPGSGLLFPFAILGSDHSEAGLIRSILGVDEATGSLTLAGDIDADGYLRLMHANTDALVEGAEMAAKTALQLKDIPGLALLISCVGRKLVMGGRVAEEVRAVGDIFGKHTTLAGFYAYGELSPFKNDRAYGLHNQTMTITCLSEAD